MKNWSDIRRDATRFNVENITPYQSGEDKKVQVERAFEALAPRYDLLNRVLSLGLDPLWRRRAVRLLQRNARPHQILDLATGTADLAILSARKLKQTQITGVDLSQAMLNVGRQKIEKTRLTNRITLEVADALALPYPDHSFDAATIAFGIRNFADIPAGLTEVHRTLHSGGHLLILELSLPKRGIIRWLSQLYMRRWLPLIGTLLTGCRKEYAYLPASIEHLPPPHAMCNMITEAGFTMLHCTSYTFGLCTCYLAVRTTPASL